MSELEGFVEWLKEQESYDYLTDGLVRSSDPDEDFDCVINGFDLEKFLDDKLKQWKKMVK